jgi:hypothetical protein
LILVNSGILYRGFKGKRLAEDDLSLATLKHRKNDNDDNFIPAKYGIVHWLFHTRPEETLWELQIRWKRDNKSKYSIVMTLMKSQSH